MKLSFSIVLILLCSLVMAQLKKSTNDIVLVKEIAVKKFHGKEYQLSVEVKTEAFDKTGMASCMALQVADGMSFLGQSRRKIDKIENNADWKLCEFSGVIDPNANKLWLYLLTYGDGDFYFDNIRFKIKEDSGWKEISLFNAGFEKSTVSDPLKGLENSKSILQNKNITVNVVTDRNPNYNKVIKISSNNAKPDDRIIYGYNNKAGKFININGIKVYYEIYGEGKPLILLHGNGGSISSYSAQIPELSKYYKVIAIDTRGQGRSKDTLTRSFSYNQFAQDLKAIIDSLNLKEVNVLGWSDGANTALILASEYPQYVKKLITMGANLNSSENAVYKRVLQSTQKDIDKLKKENKKENLVTIRLLDMLLKEPNIDPESLKKITAKTLVLAGSDDLILEKHTKLIANSITNSTLLILKDQNHFVVEENPILFNKTVLEFLKQ